VDVIFYSAFDLIDEAHEKGIDCLAITPHRDVCDVSEAQAYASSKGMLLIQGVEKMIDGYEVLILNVDAKDVPKKFSFEDLRQLRKNKFDQILTIAPHPFYPRRNCPGPIMDEYPDCFDSVEFAYVYGLGWNPNLKALEWARNHHKPVLANSDAHHVCMVGLGYSYVEAEALEAEAIFKAIREGKVEYCSKPLDIWKAAEVFVKSYVLQDLASELWGDVKKFRKIRR
jgi:predicted metal-dependent phosphoesterase TrpH